MSQNFDENLGPRRSIPFDAGRRPIDLITGDRQEAGKSDRCSAPCHPEDQQPVSVETFNSWDVLSKQEFANTRICPTCWDKLFRDPEDEEEDDG